MTLFQAHETETRNPCGETPSVCQDTKTARWGVEVDSPALYASPVVARRVIAHVDLDAFFTSVEQLLDPRLAGKPVVVGGAADQRGVVASASYEARARGIYVPMPLVRAYRICPEAHFLSGKFDAYRDFSRRVFKVCEGFSPNIERASIDEAYMDWTWEQWMALHPDGCPPIHWPLELAERLRDAILDRVGLSVSVGVGSNRMIAKIASKYCKPKGICHVASGTEQAFLRPMRLRVVPGIGKRSAEMLTANNLNTFADVQDMPQEVLVARMGEQWADRLRCIANGEGRDFFTMREAPKSISNETTFATDCRDLEEVRKTLYRLTEKAAWRLRRAGLKAGTVGVKLRNADFRTHVRARSLGFRSDCHQELYVIASQLLSELTRRPSGRKPTRLVGVQLTNLDTVAERQLALFDNADEVRRQRVDRMLDVVRERFGFKVIATAGAM